MSIDLNRNYYMVRAMGSTEKDFKIFTGNNIVGVGWSELNFTDFDINSGNPDLDNLSCKLKENFYSDPNVIHPSVLGRKISAAKRFCQIRKDDYIIVPYYNQILLAVSTGEFVYNKTAIEYDLSNQLRVEYQYVNDELKTVPRNYLSEALQRRLRTPGLAIADLGEFREEIDSLFNNETPSYVSNLSQKDNTLVENFKSTLLQNICNGKTALKAGGIGLEELTKELLECEGYTAEICSKRKFLGSGDADVEAVKSDKFSTTKLLVQVKHHSGFSDKSGIKQLTEITERTTEYDDYLMIIVTTGSIEKEVRKYGEEQGIIVVDGNEFVDWLYIHLDSLSEQTKLHLGISSAPQLC